MKKYFTLAALPVAVLGAILIASHAPTESATVDDTAAQTSPVTPSLDGALPDLSSPGAAPWLHPADHVADSSGVDLLSLRAFLPSEQRGYADWREWHPDTISLQAVPGHPVDFTVRSITPKGDYSAIVAEAAAWPGSTLVATATAGGVDFLQTIPGEPEYSVHVRGMQATVVQSLDDSACGTMDAEEISVAVQQATGEMAADEAGVNTADVLFLYDAGALDSANKQAPDQDGLTLLLNRARNHVTFANKALTDSQVTTFAWNVAGVEAAPAYARDGTLETDLNNLTRTSTELGAFADRRARALGADEVALWVTGESNYSGIAWLEGYQAVLVWGTGGSTTAHELGHNLGCRHDRREQNAPDGNGDFSYAHRFTYQSEDVGDLMSYASRRYPFFSNADLQVDVSDYLPGSHSSQLVAIGVPADQPKAAHAVRTIRAAAAGMASHRTAPGLPVITAQPSDVSVSAGSSFTLRVTATGGGLTYQWNKDGAAIVGATGASYSKSSQAADAGAYNVTVANSAGAVTSASVTVSVTAATGGGGGGGGGGESGGQSGGGAVNPWFLAVAAALAMLRFRRLGS